MKNLLLACYCANFERYDFLLKLVQPLQPLGLGVELAIFDEPGYHARLMAQRAQFAPYYTTFHGPHVEVEATSPAGSPERQRMIDAFDKSFDICRAFDAHSIVIHTSQVSFAPDQAAVLQQCALSTLREIGEMAAQRNVPLLIENVGEANHHSMLFDEDAFIELFEHVHPSSDCLIDIGHAIINGWDLEKVIRRLAGRIKAYHLHNNDGARDIHRPLFEEGLALDRAQMVELLAIAERFTPDTDWILEYAPGPHICEELVAGEVSEVLKLTGRAGG